MRRAVVSCRRDLQISPRPCADPAACGAFCANAHAAQWKSFRADRASQAAAQRRRLERGQMIQHVLLVLRAQFRVCLVVGAGAGTEARGELPALRETASVPLLVHVAKHVELLMYRAAFSKAEYAALATVPRRVQHLAAVMNASPRWRLKLLPRHAPARGEQPRQPRARPRAQRPRAGRKLWLFTPAWWRSRGSESPARPRPPRAGVVINAGDARGALVRPPARESPRARAPSTRRTRASANGGGGRAGDAARAAPALGALFDGRAAPALAVAVFSFLDGAAVVRSFALNRACRRELPRAITDLRVAPAALAALLAQLEARLAREPSAVLLPNLRHVCVRPAAPRHRLERRAPSAAAAADRPSPRPPKRLRAKAPPLPPPPPPSAEPPSAEPPSAEPRAPGGRGLQSSAPRAQGELAVLALARLLRRRQAPRLRSLCLRAAFVNSASARNGARALAEALAAPGACPRLEQLALGGNALGDYGAMCVAQALAAGESPALARLDLRANGIGHDGVRSLAEALARLGGRCRLEQLRLGGNLLTPACAAELARCLAAGALPRLAFLGLGGNFLSAASLAPVARALVRGACPALREICVGGNAELRAPALAAVFKEAADAADGASWGLFRPRSPADERRGLKRRRGSGQGRAPDARVD